ncbi:MAG: hypothetical protein MI784_15440, partial [Cytophagales bacterium]|nr:hypothetical protein [Cytophagales bacterium]
GADQVKILIGFPHSLAQFFSQFDFLLLAHDSEFHFDGKNKQKNALKGNVMRTSGVGKLMAGL